MKAATIKLVEVPDFASVGITLGGQWHTKPTFDPTVPWAADLNDPESVERASKVRLAFNLAVDEEAVIDAALGGLGEPVPITNFYNGRRWTPDELKPRGYDPDRARVLMEEAGYPNCFEFTINLVAWPGRAYLPLVGETVATQLEAELGCKIRRHHTDRATFSQNFREPTT